ncbi:MAG: hydroxymethylglutaryl-CoA lyase [Paracoccaceae bacterium]
MKADVTIFEMGPRDGLQNESKFINTFDKIKLVNLLSKSGLSKIETASFVSSRWVPQMADGEQVMDGIQREQGVSYTALTPNKKGLDRAIQANADEIAIFGSASEGFSKANINKSIKESLQLFRTIVDAAPMPVRGYVSCVTDCPYDGPTNPDKVIKVAEELLAMGCYEISLGDTLGSANPDSTKKLLLELLSVFQTEELAVHFHDTQGKAIENITIALEFGITTFDSSIAGLGGCPYAPGAKGNVSTEAVVDFLESKGFRTGIEREDLKIAAQFARSLSQ